MSAEDLVAMAEARVAELVEEMVAAKLRSLSTDRFAELAESLAKSTVVARAVDDRVRAYCETEVGNRLRCGIYDGGKVDRLFESVWSDQLDRAIRERVRSRVLAIVDEMVVEVLKGVRAVRG